MICSVSWESQEWIPGDSDFFHSLRRFGTPYAPLFQGLDDEVMVKGATGIVEHGETRTFRDATGAFGSGIVAWSQA